MARPTYNGNQMNGIGFVYLFRLDRFHKIGSSKNPAKRMKSFDNLPWKPVLVHTIASTRRGFVERLLQHRFVEQRVRGEWFDLTETDVARLCSLARLDGLDDFPEDLLPHPSFWAEPKDDGEKRKTVMLPDILAEALWRLMITQQPRLTIEQTIDAIVGPHIVADFRALGYKMPLDADS